MLEHGGRLRAAAARSDIPLADWIDLSTGINPHGWPVPPLPPEVWQRLPEANDGLEEAAAAYYGNPDSLLVAGSQAAIQCLPTLLPRAAVACLAPLYGEHPEAWRRAGHRVRLLANADLKRALAAATPYVLLCNPNNPTGRFYRRDELLDAAQQLGKRGGSLIVDEAFIDATPEESITPWAGSEATPNLIVLRSIGKFFGLAGIRVGFLFASEELRQGMQETLGPWTVSGPARWVTRQALIDTRWQEASRKQLRSQSKRLHLLLAKLGEVASTALFATLKSEHAHGLHAHFLRHGILTRVFPDSPLIRIGLPQTVAQWQRLGDALDSWSPPAPIAAD